MRGARSGREHSHLRKPPLDRSRGGGKARAHRKLLAEDTLPREVTLTSRATNAHAPADERRAHHRIDDAQDRAAPMASTTRAPARLGKVFLPARGEIAAISDAVLAARSARRERATAATRGVRRGGSAGNRPGVLNPPSAGIWFPAPPRPGGETGRRTSLRCWRPLPGMQVQFLSWAPLPAAARVRPRRRIHHAARGKHISRAAAAAARGCRPHQFAGTRRAPTAPEGSPSERWHQLPLEADVVVLELELQVGGIDELAEAAHLVDARQIVRREPS